VLQDNIIVVLLQMVVDALMQKTRISSRIHKMGETLNSKKENEYTADSGYYLESVVAN
jgi:hypothetical protein